MHLKDELSYAWCYRTVFEMAYRFNCASITSHTYQIVCKISCRFGLHSCPIDCAFRHATKGGNRAF